MYQNPALDKLKIIAKGPQSVEKLSQVIKNKEDVEKQKKRFNKVMKQARLGSRIPDLSQD